MRASLRCLNSMSSAAALSMRANSISFIGLGRMGSEMAYNLFSKRYTLAPESHFIVCDALPNAAHAFCNNFVKQFPGSKLSIAETPEMAAIASQTVVTMLPSSPHVQTAYGGGIFPALQRLPSGHGTLLIDSTTLDVGVAREVARIAGTMQASMVDAPVSGGVTGAKAATLAFLVGGDEAGYNRAEPILSTMGTRIVHCGPSGAGLAAKICNNLMLGVQQIVAGEALLLGQKLGLDPAVLTSVVGSSTGSCWSINVNNPVKGALKDKSPPSERDYEGGFATALMIKDMGLATGIAEAEGVALPLGRVAEAIYTNAVDDEPDLVRKDFSSVYKYLQRIGESGAL